MNEKNYHNQIEAAFNIHAITRQQKNDTEDVTRICKGMATELDRLCPDGREKSLALTKLEEVMFWATEAIIRQ